jgi:Tol biopolymer transport system component
VRSGHRSVLALAATAITIGAAAGAAPSAPVADRAGNGLVLVESERGFLVLNAAEDSLVAKLTGPGFFGRSPTFVPDGHRIAFASYRDGDWQIFVTNVDGTGSLELTFDKAPNDDPAWSPDGHHVAFESWRSGNADVWVTLDDGREQTCSSRATGPATS